MTDEAACTRLGGCEAAAAAALVAVRRLLGNFYLGAASETFLEAALEGAAATEVVRLFDDLCMFVCF